MVVKLLTEHNLEFLSLKGGCRGSSESILVKMPHCWKSYALAPLRPYTCMCRLIIFIQKYIHVPALKKCRSGSAGIFKCQLVRINTFYSHFVSILIIIICSTELVGLRLSQ